jgi:hypothetical protein
MMRFRGGGALPCLFLLLLCGPGPIPVAGAGGSRPFDAATIDPALARGADIVVRDDVQVFEILNERKAVHEVRTVTTDKNPRGREAGVVVLPYDSFHKVRSFEGWILDASGNKLRTLAKSDVRDYSAIQGYSLYEDGRVRYAELAHDRYPYTVVFQYEVEYDGFLGWPSWWPLSDKGPVEKSLFEIKVPRNVPVRHHAAGLDAEAHVFEKDGSTIYQWSLSNQPKLDLEPLGPSFREQAPHLFAGPERFELAGKPGDMSSWSSFGRWFHDLWSGRTELPETDAALVRTLTAGSPSKAETVRRLYEHLQTKTRYVSVQLGIGGWQPFDASYVSRLGYGDCKALTNYMKSMLEKAGIASWPAFVMAGLNEPDVVEAFPSNQFNHVILFVPLDADTVWLECTSQKGAFGELGTFTEDRNTLVVTPDGGTLVRTGSTRPGDNRLIRRAAVLLAEGGRGAADITTFYTGNQQGDVRLRLAGATPRERDDWLRRDLDIASFDVRKADFSDVDRKANELTLRASVDIPALATASGGRLFFRPNLVNRWTLRLPKNAARKHPVRLPFAAVDADTIVYQVPNVFHVESAPSPVSLETPFASYAASVVVNGTTIEYRRRLELKTRSIDVSRYEEFREFLDQVVKADQAQVVLVRKT